MATIFWVLLALFVALQVADVLTTRMVYKKPDAVFTEKNPVMAWAMRKFEGNWFLVKMALAILCVGGVMALSTISHEFAVVALVILCAAYIWVVCYNLRQYNE